MAEIVRYLGLSSGDVLPFTIMKNDVYIDDDINIDSLINLINHCVAAPRFRIFVLYPDESIRYEIPNEDIKTGGSYSENYQDGQRRSLSFSLYNEDGKYTPGIDNLWAGTRLSLEQGIERADGSIIWFKKGVFIINQSSPSESVGDRTVSITAGDKFSIFENKTGTLDDSYVIPEGSEIQFVMEDILLTSLGNGFVFDSKPILYSSILKGKKTQVEISKSAGETFGSILLELAMQLSAEIFYNATGNLTIIPINEISMDVDKPLLYKLEDNKGDYSNLQFDFNMENIINRVIVMGSSSNGAVYKAVAVNDDAKSPLCYQRIGYRTGNIINDSNISAQYLAEERAAYELRKQLIIKSSCSVNIIFNPILTVNNLLAISNDFYNLSYEKFLIQGVSCSLDYTGTMTVTISNLINLPFLTNGKVLAGSFTEIAPIVYQQYKLILQYDSDDIIQIRGPVEQVEENQVLIFKILKKSGGQVVRPLIDCSCGVEPVYNGDILAIKLNNIVDQVSLNFVFN